MSARKKRPKPEPDEYKPVRCAIVFEPQFREDWLWWCQTDKQRAIKILDLIEAITANPFEGIGKPEPLKYLSPDTWSRRITQEHRLVYRVESTAIYFLQARYHYQ